MEGSIILETKKIRKEFGALVAVNDVSLQIHANTIHSIIGPNGAGKTTYFNLLSGVIEPTSGKVFFKGRDITHTPMHKMIHLGIGRSFQITNVFPNLSVFENVRLAAQATGRDSFKFLSPAGHFKKYEERTWTILRQINLVDKATFMARTLSHGDQRKLELGIILAPDPSVLMLDEPTAGMATEHVPKLMALIKQIHDQGNKTIILVEHNMNVVMNISDRITVMHQGGILADGTPKEISANVEVQSAYLGRLYEKTSGKGKRSE